MIELTKEDYLDMRKDGLTIKEIGNFYNLSEYQVYYRAKNTWQLSSSSNKKKVNDNFFSYKTKKAYYWAGFIAADGSIEDDRDRLSIGLQIGDKNHLEKFKKAVESEHEICSFMNDQACRIRFNSKQIINDLKSIFNITARKTYTYVFPYIEEEYLLLEFLRGLIDGDGHYENRNGNYISISLASASDTFLLAYKSALEKLINSTIPQVPYLGTNKKGSCYSLTLNKQHSADLLNLLYKNATLETRLDRKFITVQHFLR
jgi:hypothetical protein